MTKEFLKNLGLIDEVIDSIISENGKDIEAEKKKTIETTTKLEEANKQLKEANNTIKDLKKNNVDNEALQAKVKEYEENIKSQKADYEAKVRNLTLDAAIEKALTVAKAKHIDLLSSKIERDKLIINNDNTITGLDEQLNNLKENYKDLFEATISGTTPTNNESSSGVTKEQFEKMGYKERVELYNSNKELYTQLRE